MNTITPSLTGITRAHGVCDCCGRTLGRVFELSNGGTYGRSCAAKLTGFKVTDQAVRIAARLAAVKAERRASNWGVEDFAAFGRSCAAILVDGVYVQGASEYVLHEWAEGQVRELWAKEG